MPVWDFPLQQLDALTLASDFRFGSVDYANDQIWDLKVSGTIPPALVFSTTYGLRACRFHIFPQFTEQTQSVSDPASFTHPPLIRTAYPNFARVTYSPFPELDAEAEYWVIDSQSCCGRLRLINRGSGDRNVRVEWAALLTPLDQGREAGHRMIATQIQRVWILSGRTGGLAPILCMLGGAEVQNVPFPALTLSADLPTGTWREWFWGHAALPSPEESYRLARSTLSRNWDAERARLEMRNAGIIDIQTGNKSWDAAFTLSQQIALGLFVETTKSIDPSPAENLPHPSLVITRQPDQGFSLRGDGSDYNTLWNGVTPLEVYYSTQFFLPGFPELVKGLIHNFLIIQARDSGFIDLRPGLGGQRSRLLAIPLLATIAWKVYQYDGDIDFLKKAYEPLVRFLQVWFSEHDRDGDGIPEMDHPSQFGFDDHPVFIRQVLAAQGAPLSVVESPAMCAFLYGECQALQQIAHALGTSDPVFNIGAPPQRIDLNVVLATLRQIVVSCWKDEDKSFHYRDRDSHLMPPCSLVFKKEGPGTIPLQRQFEEPVRLVLRLDSVTEKTQRPQITLVGTDAAGQPCREEISPYQWQWILLKTGRVTTQYSFHSLDSIEINQIGEHDLLVATSLAVCFEDLSLLLPLWAKMIDTDLAERLVEKNLLDPQRYWQPFGLPAYPLHVPRPADREGFTSAAGSDTPGWVNPGEVYLPWNVLIGEGLLSYGYRKEAAELAEHLLNGIVFNLQRDKTLRHTFQAREGFGCGERNTLDGLAPLGYFLQALGVTFISPWRVGLSGFNPFPFPVQVGYRGLKVLRLADKTVVTFPDEQVVEVFDPTPCIVSSEDEN